RSSASSCASSPPQIGVRARFNSAVRLTAFLALLLVCGAAIAQPYPSRPVHVVIAAAPGGSTDILGRVFAQRLSERMGQPFVPENRAAAAARWRRSSSPRA